MLPCADGDAFLVECLAHHFGRNTTQHEGKHARFFARRSDEPQPRDGVQNRGSVVDQFVLVARDVLQPDLFQVVECCAKSDCIRDGARFEPCS